MPDCLPKCLLTIYIQTYLTWLSVSPGKCFWTMQICLLKWDIIFHKFDIYLELNSEEHFFR